MSIEAMKRALESLTFDGFTPQDVTHRELTAKAVEALRTAIQQAEAKTDEPVAYMWQHDETGRTGFVEADQLAMGWRDANPRLNIVAPCYTHPAPGVPDADFDLICNAIDKADTLTMEGDYMLDSDDCIAVVRVMQALLSAHHGITARAKKEGV